MLTLLKTMNQMEGIYSWFFRTRISVLLVDTKHVAKVNTLIHSVNLYEPRITFKYKT